MTNLNLRTFASAAAPGAGVWSVPVRINLRKGRLPALTPSLRLPATRENRLRLRKLREAELQAWRNADTDTANAALRAEVQRSLKAERTETWLLTGLAALATGSIAFGMLNSFDFVARWQNFVSLVRTLLG